MHLGIAPVAHEFFQFAHKTEIDQLQFAAFAADNVVVVVFVLAHEFKAGHAIAEIALAHQIEIFKSRHIAVDRGGIAGGIVEFERQFFNGKGPVFMHENFEQGAPGPG